MYPDFQYLFESILKTHLPEWVGIIKTFGFFAAMAFLAAAWILTKELKRKEALGLLVPEILPYQKGKRFLKQKANNDNLKHVTVYPHQRVGDIIFLALIAGVIGAKVFNALETWNEFVKDPISSLFSGSGLTFYGGLIVATIVIYYYCKKHKMTVVADAIAPALMLAYGIGRLGCHFAGDGDWGIFNGAYVSLSNGSLKQASFNEYQQAVSNAANYFTANFGSVTNVPHASVYVPNWLPDALLAMNFPHNVNNEGIAITGCTGNYCSVLPVAVFPTSLYEAVICILLFFLIWSLRKKLMYPLHLFGFYLLLNGLERFLIEQIKVNYKYDWGFIHPAQSEIIAVLLMVAGAAILLFYKKFEKAL